LATLMLSLAVSIDIGISTNFNLPFYIMLTLIIPAIMILFAEKIALKEIISQYSKNYLITGLTLGLLVFFLLRAYQFGQVTVVTSLAAVSILINILVAYIFLKERDYKARKIIAACITILGIFLTVIK